MASFHWSMRTELRDSVLDKTLAALEDAGYESALCQFQTHSGDPFLLASHMADKTERLKFLVALRPYALTPAYARMMADTFVQLHGERLMLNLVAGTFDSENNNLFFNSTTTLEQRREHIPDFITNFRRLRLSERDDFFSDSSFKIAITGSSDEAIDITTAMGDIILMLLSDFKRKKDVLNPKWFRKCVKVSVVIGDTLEDATALWESLPHAAREEGSTLVGTKESLKNDFKKLEEDGITDFLISNVMANMHDMKVHGLIKELVYGERS